MPNKIPITEIKEKLPPFVTLIESSYRGIRYPATFLDIDYNEEFISVPSAVIKLQHGCKTRSNYLRSQSGKDSSHGRKGRYGKISLDRVKAQLPPYLKIIDSSYRGVRYKAEFIDTEYNTKFSAYVRNVIREKKGYCNERKLIEFKKSISISAEEIQLRINKLYDGQVKLIPETYNQTKSVASWEYKGKLIRYAVSAMLKGVFNQHQSLSKWRSYVLVRDDFTCQRCDSITFPQTHHILTWSKYPEQRFNIHNGICLCEACHDQYHALWKNEETISNFISFIGEEKAELINERLARPVYYPVGI